MGSGEYSSMTCRYLTAILTVPGRRSPVLEHPTSRSCKSLLDRTISLQVHCVYHNSFLGPVVTTWALYCAYMGRLIYLKQGCLHLKITSQLTVSVKFSLRIAITHKPKKSADNQIIVEGCISSPIGAEGFMWTWWP